MLMSPQSHQCPLHGIIHGDAYELLPTIPDKSFDAVIIDPPYGMGIDTWDNKVDVAFFTEQFKRIGKEFYAVFGQMPYIRKWDREAEKHGFHFCEHVSWVKRSSMPSYRLLKTHEEIFIYAIGKLKKFYVTKGRYEDVKIPGVMVDLISLEAIERYIGDLHYCINHKTPRKVKQERTCHSVYKRFNSVRSTVREWVNFTNAWSFKPESQKTFNRGGKFHPTMKPLLLQERLVDMLTPEGGSVLDCFSGSGTTAIACKRLNRQFLCIEKEQEYYELSVERLNNDTYQPELTGTEEAAA